MDMQRLQVESQEMRRLFPGFSLWQDDDGQYYWEGLISAIRFRIKYTNNYPLERASVFDNPRLTTRHRFSNGSLCLMETGEWSANFTAATIVGEIIRFVDENRRGLTG